MYNSRLQIFGSEVYVFGETHIDQRETKVTYEICERLQPDLICVESPKDELYPSKSTGHKGLQAYTDKENVPVIGIDTEPSDKIKGRVGEKIGDVFISEEKDKQREDLSSHRSRRMDDPITNIEDREEDMVYNIFNSITYYNPDKVFILVGKMHADALTDTLSFVGSF